MWEWNVWSCVQRCARWKGCSARGMARGGVPREPREPTGRACQLARAPRVPTPAESALTASTLTASTLAGSTLAGPTPATGREDELQRFVRVASCCIRMRFAAVVVDRKPLVMDALARQALPTRRTSQSPVLGSRSVLRPRLDDGNPVMAGSIGAWGRRSPVAGSASRRGAQGAPVSYGSDGKEK